MSQTRILVIGHGVAGLSAAQAARAQDAGAEVILVGDEPYDAYYRPRLSHDLATGIDAEKMRLRAAGFYAQHRIVVHREATVARFDLERHAAILTDGKEMVFDACVLATGSRSFIPPIAGGDRPGVLALRTVADAQAIRARALETTTAAVAGGGLLGLEVAYGLSGLVKHVIVLERGDSLLRRQLDQAGGELFAAVLARSGIEVMTRTEVTSAAGDAAGSLTELGLKDGRTLGCDLLVIAAGVRPRIELAQAAGLLTDRGGVVVDDRMAASAAGVFACGDVASHRTGNYSIWPQAMAQGRVAGANAAGGAMTYVPVVPQNLLTVAGTSVFAVGEAGALDGAVDAGGLVEVVRADQAAGRYAKFRIREGSLVGAMLVGEDALAKLARPAVEGRLAVGDVLATGAGDRFDRLVALLGG